MTMNCDVTNPPLVSLLQTGILPERGKDNVD